MLLRRPLLMIAVAAGCSDPVTPLQPDRAIRVEAMVPLRLVGVREASAPEMPAVRVVDAATRVPVAGQVVTFTLTSPVGLMERVVDTTGSDGIARIQAWKTGPALGLYTATATTTGWGQVMFSMMVPGNIVAIYDLKSINGFPMPYSSWRSEEHLVLYESGAMNRFTNMLDGPFTYSPGVAGTYTRDADRISYAMDCIPNPFGQCISERRSLTVRGMELVSESIDWYYGDWREVYALRGAQ